MTLCRGNTILFRSSLQLPRHRRCFRNYRETRMTVRCASLGVEVPGHRHEQLTRTLILRLLKTHFFTLILDCEKSMEYN